MQPINTLDEFFTRSGAEVSLYHMGRRVTACSRETLRAFENAEQAWPEPWQGQARLGIVFRLGAMEEPAIWFLALPLDEQGMLSPAQRDALLTAYWKPWVAMPLLLTRLCSTLQNQQTWTI